MVALLRVVDGAKEVSNRRALLPGPAARSRTAARLAAAGTSVARRFRTAVASATGRFRTAVASAAGGLAAAVAGVAGGLTAAIAAAAVLPLALLEQTLQATKQVVLLPHAAARSRTAARLAAAVAGSASGLRTAIAGATGGLRTTTTSPTSGLGTAVAGTTAGLTATSTGVAAGLTARGTALVAEHPVKELETKRLATNGDTENQRTEEHHTLHRATSPLLVEHPEVDFRFCLEASAPRGL
jgi:hypothetical protein